MAQEPARPRGYLESDCPQVFHVLNRGGLSARRADLEARGVVQWMLDKVHTLGNGLDEMSTGQRSLMYPWDAP